MIWVRRIGKRITVVRDVRGCQIVALASVAAEARYTQILRSRVQGYVELQLIDQAAWNDVIHFQCGHT